ncbi:MAG: glycosyltransferase [Candidatus Omnitrophota bacterium]|nr:glycosyltransferase [Candidatus Omnitrophota bacterium]
MPWLSVLIPTYNGEKYLSAALESVAAEATPDIECIISDDGSVDGTLSIVERYRKKLKITVEQHSGSKNWAANTNRALRRATGDYVSILHQDDEWLPGRIRVFRKLTRENPGLELFLSSSQFAETQGKKLGLWRCPLPAYPEYVDATTFIEHLLIQNFIFVGAPFFKREAALSVGGMDEKLWFTPDWDLWLKLGSRGKVIYYAEPLASFRLHSQSQTMLLSGDREGFRQQLSSVTERHLERWNGPPGVKGAVRRAAAFSVDVNVALAGSVHGRDLPWFDLIKGFLALGPSGGCRYLRDSRILERGLARLRAGKWIARRATANAAA